MRPFHGHLHPLASRALRKVCDQLRPDSLETPGYGKRCSIGYLSACSTLIPALSSLKPSIFTHRLRVGDAASRAEAVNERWHPVIWSLCVLVSCVFLWAGPHQACLRNHSRAVRDLKIGRNERFYEHFGVIMFFRKVRLRRKEGVTWITESTHGRLRKIV